MSDVNVQINVGAEGAQRGAKEAREAVDGILDRLKEFKGEAVQAGREAKFFANELAGIIPGADGAKGALKDLLAVGLSGSVIGAASEGVKLLVAVFHDLKEKEDQTRESVQKYVDEADKSLEAVTKRVDALLLAWRNLTAAQTIAATDLKVAQAAEEEADAEALKAQLALGSARTEATKAAAASNMKGAEAEKFIAAMTKASAEAYDAALTKLTKAKDTIIGIEEAIGKAAKGEAQNKAVKDEEEFRKQILDSELADITHFNAEKKKQDNDAAQAAGEAVKLKFDADAKAQADAFKALQADGERRLKYQIDLDKRMQDADAAEAERRKKIAIDFVKPIEQAFAASIRSMIVSGKSFTDAMQGMFVGLVDAVVSGFLKMAAQAVIAAVTGTAASKAEAVSSTSGHIAESAAGAYASQAFIPFIGPELGAAAAAQATALLEGMTGPLLSAAGGADLPAGGPFPAVLHSREMVLPESLADVIRGGGMGGDVHLHIHTAYADAHGIRQLAKDPAFARGLKEAVRLGRIGF